MSFATKGVALDKNITIRFYRVERENQQTPLLRAALEGIAGIALSQRHHVVGSEFTVRLERLRVDGATAIDGEFTRIQTTNFPSEVHDDGTHPLGVDAPLGHGMAFRFDVGASIIATQYDPRVISPGRMFDYIAGMWNGARYRLRPIVRNDMWDRFNRGPTRKVQIAMASPSNLGDLEGEAQAASEAARLLGDAYEAPMLNIELSMGRRRGALSEGVKNMVSSVLDAAALGTMDVRKLRATTYQGDGRPNDEIDLLEELLTVKDELALPDNNPNQSYEVRRAFLAQSLNANV